MKCSPDGIATVGVDAGPGAGVSGKGDAAAVVGAGTSGWAGTFSTGSSPFPMSAVPSNPTIASMSSMTSGTGGAAVGKAVSLRGHSRSEEHTAELQSLMSISYAVFCLKKKKKCKEQRNMCI